MNTLTRIISTNRYTLLLITLIVSAGAYSDAQTVKGTKSDSTDRTKWFEDAKYGMFIHWGPYAEAAGEWKAKHYYGSGEIIWRHMGMKSMQDENKDYNAFIPWEEYDELSRRFNPVKFDADKWVSVAKEAGMKYMVLTAKHGDGFAMFRSAASEHNIYDFTPFKRDPLKELAEACRKEGIKLCFYYCQYWDRWGPKLSKDNRVIPNDEAMQKKFLEYYENKCKPQLKEILTGYGPISMVWFDGFGLSEEQAKEVADWVHKYQPDCLISERIGYGLGEVRGLGDSEFPKKVIEEPAEAIFTHNDTWGYIERDNNWKSSKDIIHHLVKCNAKGANFMLNVGPKGDGSFPEMAVSVMKKAGQWIRRNEESIYGTTHSPFPELSWGECTHRPGKLYLHVLKWPNDLKLRVPSVAENVESVHILVNGKKLKYTKDGKDVLVNLPARCPDQVNTVIVVDYNGDLNIEPVQTLMENCEVEFGTVFADLSGNAKPLGFHYSEEFGSWYKANVINKWSSEKDCASWQFRAPKAGLYFVELDYSYPTSSPKREGLIMIDENEKLYFECKGTGDQRHHFQKQPVGVIRISEPGYHKLSIRPTGEGQGFIKLRSLTIEPFE